MDLARGPSSWTQILKNLLKSFEIIDNPVRGPVDHARGPVDQARGPMYIQLQYQIVLKYIRSKQIYCDV